MKEMPLGPLAGCRYSTLRVRRDDWLKPKIMPTLNESSPDADPTFVISGRAIATVG
jgi:hypothetical protein